MRDIRSPRLVSARPANDQPARDPRDPAYVVRPDLDPPASLRLSPAEVLERLTETHGTRAVLAAIHIWAARHGVELW